MSIIRVLPEVVCNQIAAGEVIERPASVVKELLENAIDAHARKIRIMIEKAGVRLIQISDDGDGMDKDDAILCFETHGTSKIHEEKDLHSIASYGFRGEAIPSIASVARVLLKTRHRDSDIGSQVVVDGGKMRSVEPVGIPQGTEFTIRDLFYNVPARRKFLRTDATEERHIYETVLNMALPHPEIAFELYFDGRRTLQSPAADTLLPRLQFFFGKQFSKEMLPLDTQTESVRVTGWIARHGVVRNSRREQRFFVNGRAVDTFAMLQGVKEGYGSLVEKGCYPPCVLFVECDPQLLDVNVHPAKREIRFRNEHLIIRAISEGIQSVLQTVDAPAVAVNTNVSLRTLIGVGEINVRPLNERVAPNIPQFENTPTPPVFYEPKKEPTPSQENIEFEIPETPTSKISTEANAPVSESHVPLAIEVIGILNDTYILARFEDGLVVIDQHAAHERVLFEKILERAQHKENSASQKLLFPIPIELTRIESALMKRYAPIFQEVGFDISDIGVHSIMISALPIDISHDSVETLFSEILTHLMEEDAQSGRLGPQIDILARVACKAAVKAHDKLSLQEAQALIHQMGACIHPFSCPHGRPTLIHISLKELEKRFSRS